MPKFIDALLNLGEVGEDGGVTMSPTKHGARDIGSNRREECMFRKAATLVMINIQPKRRSHCVKRISNLGLR